MIRFSENKWCSVRDGGLAVEGFQVGFAVVGDGLGKGVVDGHGER